MRRTPSSPGRPLAFAPDSALEAAMRLFWRRGYEATSMQDLERHTGLSRSSLYNSFGSKRELFERAVAEYARRGERVFAALEHGERGIADIRAFFDALVERLSGARPRPGCLMVNSVVEFGGADAAMSRSGKRYFGRVHSALAGALRRAARLGEIPAAGVENRARLLLALAIAMNVHARAGAGRDELEALWRAARRELEAWRREATPDGTP